MGYSVVVVQWCSEVVVVVQGILIVISGHCSVKLTPNVFKNSYFKKNVF